jgi:hypothetical protein
MGESIVKNRLGVREGKIIRGVLGGENAEYH